MLIHLQFYKVNPTDIFVALVSKDFFVANKSYSFAVLIKFIHVIQLQMNKPYSHFKINMPY